MLDGLQDFPQISAMKPLLRGVLCLILAASTLISAVGQDQTTDKRVVRIKAAKPWHGSTLVYGTTIWTNDGRMMIQRPDGSLLLVLMADHSFAASDGSVVDFPIDRQSSVIAQYTDVQGAIHTVDSVFATRTPKVRRQ